MVGEPCRRLIELNIGHAITRAVAFLGKLRTRQYKTNNTRFFMTVSAAIPQVIPIPSTHAVTPRDRAGGWITDYAWISGVVGVIATLAVAVLCQRNLWLDNGILWNGQVVVADSLAVKLACLLMITATMCVTEFIRLYFYKAGPGLTLHPDVVQKRWLTFLLDNVWRYAALSFMFWLAVNFYHGAGEYGFVKRNVYYQPWFMMLDWLFTAFLWAGLPYLLLTRALLHNPHKDTMSYHVLLEYLGLKAAASPPLKLAPEPEFTLRHKKVLLGLIVRLFFAPVMTVFFVDMFGSLVKNLGYVFEYLPNYLAAGTYTHARFNTDLFNVGKDIIFTIDVALAWCGYVLVTRWLDNETRSAEPTTLGWVVCLISYPPFRNAGLGLYFAFGSENYVFQLGNPWVISLFVVLVLVSFTIYTSATVAFGVRFSNLTHRGIIRKGAYAIVRHPAYASKNLGWWLCIFPVSMYLALVGKMAFGFALAVTAGLAAQSYLYYWRAITEERHLSQDPDYQEYCQQVKYRFIPGVF